MKKLKLDLDDLQVESFATEPETASGGVLGYYGGDPNLTKTICTEGWGCLPPTQDGSYTCGSTQENTCWNSCNCHTMDFTCADRTCVDC